MKDQRTKPKGLVGLYRDVRRNPVSYLLASPAIIYTLIFGYFTYPYLVMAFQRFDYRKNIFNAEWIGFGNFQYFVGSSAAFDVTLNTLWLNLLFLVFTTLTAVIIAIVLNELRARWFKRLTQSLMIFPTFLSWVFVSYMLFSIFSMEHGILNSWLVAWGWEPVMWYTEAEAWPAILVGMRIWKGAGLMAIIYLAAITGIDESLYEAAEIDGANRWHKIRFITLPLIASTISIMTLISIGRMMYGDFGMIYALIGDNGTLYSTTDVIDTYVYRSLRQVGDPAEATAIGLFQSAVGFVLVVLANRIAKKYFREGALF